MWEKHCKRFITPRLPETTHITVRLRLQVKKTNNSIEKRILSKFFHREPYVETNIIKDVRMFVRTSDWKRELERTKCPNWRISHINQNYQTSPYLMEALIVPNSVTDATLTQAVEHFRNRFCPVWVWGTENGAALVRMADLLHTINDRTQENILLESIRKSHPSLIQPYIIDLSQPTPKDIQTSYIKLRDLCTPDSIKLYKTQDMKFYALLDQTKWLYYVSLCLMKACEGAKQIYENKTTVVLQEGNILIRFQSSSLNHKQINLL